MADPRVQQARERAEQPEEFGLITREHALYAARNAARNQGYAIAVHGSMVKDLDLVAIPWRETAIDAQQLAEIIAAAIPGVIMGDWEQKPYGRMGITIYPRWTYGFDKWWVDLSVMPRADASRVAALETALRFVRPEFAQADNVESWHWGHVKRGEPYAEDCGLCIIDAALAGSGTEPAQERPAAPTGLHRDPCACGHDHTAGREGTCGSFLCGCRKWEPPVDGGDR